MDINLNLIVAQLKRIADALEESNRMVNDLTGRK